MVASLNGIIVDQVYGDNSGGAEFDTDGDGTATQEDEFVSFTNTTGAPIDISGWEVWNESVFGAGAPDQAQSGLFHTFPAGTVIAPGETLFIINEISGTPPSWAQEASEGGVESGAGGTSTNFISEGNSNTNTPEAIALVNTATGDYLVFNMSSRTDAFDNVASFPGATKVAEIDGQSVQDDMNAGSSYQYNSATDSYDYGSVFVPCFGPGTLIMTPTGEVPIEDLRPQDLVMTIDHGPQPIRMLVRRTGDFSLPSNLGQKPIILRKNALGPNAPNADLTLSPQHRILIVNGSSPGVLGPACGFSHLPKVRVKNGAKRIVYTHIVLDWHEILLANNVALESYFRGPYAMRAAGPTFKILDKPDLTHDTPARPLLTLRQTRQAVKNWEPLERRGVRAAFTKGSCNLVN